MLEGSQKNPFHDDNQKSFIQQVSKTPYYRYQSVNKSSNLEIDYTKSMHSRSLQQSNYIVIENDFLRMKKLYQSLKGSMFDSNEQKY